MKVITANLLNRFWKKGVEPIRDSLMGEINKLNENIEKKANSNHTHNYAISSSAGGSAVSAVKLDTASAGSATQPCYFTGGKPVACTHTLGKSVPANAVFTDTNTWRGIQNNLTSTATDQSLSAAQGKILNESKARIANTGWGTSLKITRPHGLLLKSTGYVCLIWVAGSAGSYELNHSVIYGNEDMNLTVNKTTGEVTATMKSGNNAGITYIGM